MAIYTFYPRQPDGSALTFESYETQDDDDAFDKALEILRDHGSCASVSVWIGDRRLGDVRGPVVTRPLD